MGDSHRNRGRNRTIGKAKAINTTFFLRNLQCMVNAMNKITTNVIWMKCIILRGKCYHYQCESLVRRNKICERGQKNRNSIESFIVQNNLNWRSFNHCWSLRVTILIRVAQLKLNVYTTYIYKKNKPCKPKPSKICSRKSLCERPLYFPPGAQRAI